MMESRQGLVTGSEVDGYLIQEVLGRGGMGIVYKAEDVALSRTVALKVIDPALARDESFIRRFRSEARALARVDSPHIVSVHALRRTEFGMFIVMEYVDGGTLGDVLAGGPLSWEDAYPIIRQMLMAFEQAHGVGVIHRDIKPGNIMLSNSNQVKVTDFGLAKVREGSRASTVTQGVAGTLYYMSPEQVKGLHDLDHRSDLYALGMTIYEMLAGQLPFDKDGSEFAIMRTIVEQSLPPPSELHADVPRPVSDLIMRALQKKPDDRFSDADEMLKAFEAYDARRAAADGSSTTVPFAKRHATTTAVALAAVILLAVGGYVLYDNLTAAGAAQAGPGQTDSRAISERAVDATLLDGETLAQRVQEPPDLPPAEEETATPPVVPEREEETSSTTTTTPPARASLTLQAADEDVRIQVNGEVRSSSGTFSLPPGTHTVTFVHPDHGEHSVDVDLEAGEEFNRTFYLTGTVAIAPLRMEGGGPSPWAQIWVDGEAHGTAPGEVTLGPGTHMIELTKRDYDILDSRREVAIVPGFERSEHKLTFTARKQ